MAGEDDRGGQDRDHVLQTQRIDARTESFELPRLDIHRVNQSLMQVPGQRQGEDPGPGAQIGHDRILRQIQGGDHEFGLQVGDPFGSQQALDV